MATIRLLIIDPKPLWTGGKHQTLQHLPVCVSGVLTYLCVCVCVFQVCDGGSDDPLLHFLVCVCSSDVVRRPIFITCRKHTNQRSEGNTHT